MTSNPFQQSPFEATDVEGFSVDTPQSRGMAPTKADVIKRAKELDIDPNLALSLFSQESSGNWNSRDSNKGAVGGMQVMPDTYASMMGTRAGMRDPWNNLEAGLRYLSYGQKTLNTKDPALLAAGYHAGYDREDLKRGIIPNVSDGKKNTRDYAREVAARVTGAKDYLSTLNKEKPNLFSLESEGDTTLEELNSSKPGLFSIEQPDDTQAQPEKPYMERLFDETQEGFADMQRSLETARWALGGGDDTALADNISKNLQTQRSKQQNAAQQEINKAYQDVTNAQGVIDTTIAGAKALGTSLMNPKETSIEIARNAANSLPTIAGGAAGAGAGAAVGAGIGAAGAGAGAIPGAIIGSVWGGRTGMAVGTTATELGAEIQDMVQKRLDDQKLEPTAQNVLAVMSEKGFKDEARAQGLKKGLTVAAVDQVFLGLGGKVATAPARKIASQALEEQGMDMATRAGRKAALASPAGQAALKAAKPSVAANVGAGAAALGVDATGESIGEGLSQKVARGEVDYGDALREGVVSVGQSAVEVAGGKTIESAKIAAATAKGAVAKPANAPSEAAGPLSRANENAAAQPDRVIVTAPDGEVSGTVTGTSPDGQTVQIVGDDGQTYTFNTGPGGVTVAPDAPNAPLSNALEAAAAEEPANDNAPEATPPAAEPASPAVEAPAAETPAPVAETVKPAEPAAAEIIDVSGRTDQQLAYLAEHGQAGWKEAAQAELARRGAAAPEIKPVTVQKAATPADMTDEELKARLKYIADQAKTNGGWNKMLVEQRRTVEKEINTRASAATTAAPAGFTMEQPEVVQATPAQEAAATMPKELAGAKPRFNYGKKAFELKFDSDLDRAAFIAAQPTKSKRDAEYLAFAMQHSGMDEAGVRAHGAQVREAIKAMAKDGKPGTLKVPEVARSGVTIEKTPAPAAVEPTTTYQQRNAERLTRVKQAKTQDEFDAITAEEHSDAERDFTGTDGLRMAVNDRKSALKHEASAAEEKSRYDAGEWIGVAETGSRSAAEQEAAKAQADDQANEYRVGAGQNDGWTVMKRKKVSQPKAETPKLTKLTKEDEEHLFGTDKKRAAALERIAKGTAYFGTGEKAQEFIKKNGLTDTHTVEQTGKVRFEVKAKEQENVTNERAGIEPNGTEKVVEAAGAEQAAPAAVQPDAREEARQTVEDIGRKDFADGKRREAPAALSEKDQALWYSGYDSANAEGQQDELDAEMRSYESKAEAQEAKPTSDATLDKLAAGYGYPGGVDTMPEGLGKTARKLNDAIAANDVAKVQEILHPDNKRSRDAFEALYDVKLPRTVKGTNATVADVLGKAETQKPQFTYAIKPTEGGFLIESDNGGGVVMSGRPNGAGIMNTVPPRVFKTEADARAYMDKKGMAEAAPEGRLQELETLRSELQDKFDAQGVVKNARTRDQLDQVNTAIAEIKHPDILKAVNGDYKLANNIALSLRMNEGTEPASATIARALRDLVEPYRTDMTNAVLKAIGEKVANSENAATINGVEAQGYDNGSQKLDQPGTRELEGKQSDAVQGAESVGQTGNGAEGSGGTDLFGSERAGSERPQPAGSVGNDAGEVSAPATGERTGRGSEQGRSTVQRSERAAKSDSASAERGNQRELIPTDGTRAQDRSDDFVITDEDAIGEGGAKTKFKQNVAAIRLLKELQAANRQATRAEQAVLAKYVGWGGIPQAFARDNGEVSKGWEKEVAELKSVMTPDELAAAAASTRNAHYTSPEIVGAVWDAAKHFGFQGGRVLEPSVGVGNFFGLMPTTLRSASQLTGVELDHITGGIAKQLYPQANIAAPVGFQDFSAPDNYFDLAIGNPPFGREGIYDAIRRKISGFSIHNYFFAKSIDTVKPNGVLAMVVTNRLLDSMGDKARQYIADRAEFLGAVRLPNNAFLANAGTQVTTDIIFLRKLTDSERTNGLNVNGANGSQRWMDVKQVTDANGKTVPLNEYFAKNPDMMLGEFGAYGSMYSPDDAALVARPGQDTPALLKEAIAKLPSGFMEPPTHEPAHEGIEPMHDVSHVKVGSVFEQGGQIFERKEDMLGKQQAVPVSFPSEKAKERVTGMIGVRDALIDVRRLQLQENVSDKALEAARATLNKVYDAFVKANGPVNSDANKRLMRDDPTWPQIAALEDKFDKGISAAVAKTTGEKARPASAEKAAIFFKRTQSPYHAPEKANSAKDAMVASLAERGRVDLDYMAGLYGHTPEAIAKELDGLVFKTPSGGWETRDAYLSGNVKKKLAQAIDAAKTDPAFKANVDALQAVQPADIEAVDIDVKTGAHWVPADVMADFVATISEGKNAKAVYNPVNASWTISVDSVPQSALTQYATDRASMLAVLEAAANQKQITVYDKNYDGSRTLNEAATTAANEKVERVKAEWRNWIWADDARRERLHRIYNDTFNTDVQREYDGSHLSFPGKVGDDIIALRPHQKNAVWRMIQSGTTLLDHTVGAGKTFTVIAGVMEMRRMGLAQKPMIVVPNHLVGQWAEDFMKLYPGANILAATKKDFEKDNRKKLFARIAAGDWDAVIVAHSSFGKVEVEPEFQSEFIKQQIADMDTSISAMRAAEGKSSRNVKQIEKQKAALEEKLKKLFDTGSKDDNLYFSELGVDAVALDEAHEFKNLGFSTGMQRVAGLGNPTGSNKAADMFMKVQAVLRRTGGRNVTFATGTPISNTMAEMYTMQRYLDYQTLKDQGIAHFDAWAKTFGEVVTDWELSPSGQYKMNSRFAKFVNMPELMQRYQSFADVINRDDIDRQLAAQGKKLPVPKVKGGKPQNVVVERSPAQAAYIGIPTTDENGQENYPKGSLVWRAENLPKKAEKGADNMLKIMSDARKAALDMRLIDPSYPDNPASKVNEAASRIKATYDKWEKDKGAQLVFIDLSTPKGAVAKEAAALRELIAKAEEGDEHAQEKLDAMSPDELLALDSSFSVYDDLKQKLIDLGIPAKEIAFIHDANTELQKEDLFGKVRSGRVRVLFGSTAKMGAGMNVQERLVALHHLDAPWRPSDLEQREGRIIRQGNKLYEADPEGFEVEINRYATKQTLDSRMWQTIEAKARFIEQVRKGAGNTREIEDIAGEAANSAEMKAASSGNPLILEEMSLRQAIRKLENQQAEHDREQFRIKDRMRWLATSAESLDRNAAEMEKDAKLVPAEFAATIGKTTYDKHGEAGEAILNGVAQMMVKGEDSRAIGTYGGFKLTVDDTSVGQDKRAVLTVSGTGEYQIEANPGSSTTGLALRLQNTVKGLAEQAKQARANAERNRADIPKLQSQIKPWGQGAELADTKARHAAIIEQLKPKKKEQPAQSEEGDVRMSRSGDVEGIFEGLEGRGLTRKRALEALKNHPQAEQIRYIEDNFWSLLSELDEQGKVDVKC